MKTVCDYVHSNPVRAKLRHETILPLKWVAARLRLGTWKSARTRLQTLKTTSECNDGNQSYSDPFSQIHYIYPMIISSGRLGIKASNHTSAGILQEHRNLSTDHFRRLEWSGIVFQRKRQDRRRDLRRECCASFSLVFLPGFIKINQVTCRKIAGTIGKNWKNYMIEGWDSAEATTAYMGIKLRALPKYVEQSMMLANIAGLARNFYDSGVAGCAMLGMASQVFSSRTEDVR